MREWYANKIAKHTQWRITDTHGFELYKYKIEMRITFPFGLGTWRMQPLTADNYVFSCWDYYDDAFRYITRKLENHLEGVLVK